MQRVQERHSVHTARLSQVGFIVPILICMLIEPHFWLSPNEGGVTDYAIATPVTAGLYLIAFSAGIFWSIQTSKQLRREGIPKIVSAVLYIFACLLMLDAVTAYGWRYSSDYAIDEAHVIADGLLFLAEFLVTITATVYFRRFVDWLLLVGQLSGVIVVILTYLGALHLLFLGEALVCGAFAFVLIRAVRRL